MKQWNEEEIRAAMGPILNCSNNEERIIAELRNPTPPPIHPDVPVMYDFNGEPCTAFAHYDFHSGVTNIRPLIPTEEVKVMLGEVLDEATCLGSERVDADAAIDRKIAHYEQTGET